MKISDEMRTQLKQGADSVFEYIERTAETVREGVKWRTYTHKDEPQYGADLYNGVAEISLFLSDYHRFTGVERAGDLALGALRWCISPGYIVRHDFETAQDTGLGGGWAGIGLAWLRFWLGTNGSEGLTKAVEIADKLLESEYGPRPDLLWGTAGTGLFLLRMWEATEETRFKDGAIQCGKWLERHAIREDFGFCWPNFVGTSPPNPRLGLMPGVAGISYFLLHLYKATADSGWARFAEEGARTLSKEAIPYLGGLNWAWHVGSDKVGVRCQWCVGASGIGLFYATAYELLEEPSYLDTALAAGEATFAYGDERNNPCQCHGLAGDADFFFELYRVTEDTLWLDRGHDFVRRMFKYRTAGPDGSWQADHPEISSPEFMNGAAGVGHFFLRLLSPDQLRMPIL